MEDEAIERDLLVVAGEASGDLHGARLLSALRQRIPGIRSFGLGGSHLRESGMELVAESSEISVVGITEVAKILPRARQIFAELLAEVDRRGARAAVLIDFPDFNLRLAKALKRRGVKVLYYISPQIWAWRRGRIRTIARVVDRMLVILPFEVAFYRAHGVDAVHVGHPLVDEVPMIEQLWDRAPDPPTATTISLLPGSRRSEIAAHLPVMLAAAVRLQEERPCVFRLIRASTISASDLEPHLRGLPLEVEVVTGDRFAAIADSHLAICASGTATLEVGLLGTPMVMVYKMSPWTYLLGRLLVRLPNVALVNLVLERRVVPELLQSAASPESIAATATAILDDRDRIRSMRADLAELRGRLGERGASQRAADEISRELRPEAVA